MFKNEGFAPVHITGPKSPRIFVYANEEDTLLEIQEPGYFNSKKILLLPKSFIKVICKDAIAEIVVDKNHGDVTMRGEFIASFVKKKAKRVMPPRAKGGKFVKAG